MRSSGCRNARPVLPQRVSRETSLAGTVGLGVHLTARFGCIVITMEETNPGVSAFWRGPRSRDESVGWMMRHSSREIERVVASLARRGPPPCETAAAAASPCERRIRAARGRLVEVALLSRQSVGRRVSHSPTRAITILIGRASGRLPDHIGEARANLPHGCEFERRATVDGSPRGARARDGARRSPNVSRETMGARR